MPPVKKNPTPRVRKNQPILLGRVRHIERGAVSKSKTTAEKASFLRRYIDLPFKAAKRFKPDQVAQINKLYDGTKDGATPALRRYSGTTRVKIKKENIDSYRDAGFLVVAKKYKYRGKTKKGHYILQRHAAPGSRLKAHSYGITEKIGSRVEYHFNVDSILRGFLIDNPEAFVKALIEKNKKVLAKYSELKPTYKIVFQTGTGGREFEDLENFAAYIDAMDEVAQGKITGIAVVYHVPNSKPKKKKSKKKSKPKPKRKSKHVEKKPHKKRRRRF